MCFWYYLCLGAETYDAYERRGISREIFRDTFYDLTFWCENCFLEYGEYGIDEYDWFFRDQLDLKSWILVLQQEKEMVKKGDPIIRGRKAHTGECEGIYCSGNGFLGERDAVSVSFLAALGLKDILPEKSNIIMFHQFQKKIGTA